MDGNRRWARNRGLDVIHGHSEGALKLVEIVQWWMEHNGGKLRYMTVWAFSTDNFNRPASEVDGLMKLIGRELQRLVHFPHVHMFRIRISVVGDRSRLPQSLIDGIKAIEHATASYDSFFWQIAVAYSGQGEIVSSVRDALMTSVVENSGSGQCDMTAAGPSGPSLADRLAKLDTGAISQCTYNGRLGFPRANAILRTGGDWRTSGFMLWDTQYAELFFSKKMWPDIKEWDFLNMLVDYNKREIRHGK
ncbi:Decaprenyl diphosphate synthase-like protein [Dissophora ornata]|nr:Decaprenyl diphosphate synthase-like protein [Dissophora ornata]